jgi:hypothetical protein
VLITRAATGGGGGEYSVQFIGLGSFAGTTQTLRTVTTTSDTDDIIRRQIATAVRVGVLQFMARDPLPPGLAVSVRTEAGQQTAAGADR